MYAMPMCDPAAFIHDERLLVQRPVFPVYHAVGNHCLSVPREQLLERLQLPGSHYSISLPAKWQIIFLDTTEMSGHGRMPEVSLF